MSTVNPTATISQNTTDLQNILSIVAPSMTPTIPQWKKIPHGYSSSVRDAHRCESVSLASAIALSVASATTSAR